MAGFTITALNEALDALGGTSPANTWTWFSLHTGDPGNNGGAEVVGGAYARQQTTWSAASNAQKAGTQVTFNIPAGTTVSYWGIWTLVSGGTFGFGEPLPTPVAFSSSGLYLLTVTLTATG